MTIKKPNVSSLVKSQLPEFIREDYTAFAAFLEAYYDFLKQNYDVNLLDVRDIDNTLDGFVKYFKREFAIDIPSTLTDDRFLISKIKEYYLAKGTDRSFQVLMSLLFGKNASVEYPSRQMLRASDGKWNQDVSIFAKVNAGLPEMIIGRLVDIVTPTKIIKVQIDKTQNVEVEVDRIVRISEDTYEFFIDRRFFGNISVGDRMRYSNLFDATIVSTTSKAQIQRPGRNFKPGELYEVKNGSGVGSILKISRVDVNGSIEALEFVKYGIGYTTDFTATLLPYGGTSATLAGATSLNIGGASPSWTVGLGDTTNGFFEQGYVNKSDYNIQTAEEALATGEGQVWDGTYVGEIVREFYEDNKYTVLNTEEPAVIRITLGPLTKYPGYYTTNDGFLDDAIFIQDSRYYQAFSYVLKIDERLENYKSVTKTLLHPAGMALFGEYDLRNEFDLGTSLESMIKYLALTFQDNVLTGDSQYHFDIHKPLSDSISESDSNIIDVSKPLGAQQTYNGATENTSVTVTDASRYFFYGKYIDIGLLNDGVTMDYNQVTPSDSIGSKDLTKLLNGHYLNNGFTADNNIVTPSDSEVKLIGKTLDSGHYLFDQVATDAESVTVTESNVLSLTKYMDSEGSYAHYLNDGTTLDNDKATAEDSGGDMWINPYTDPYPQQNSYFLNDSGNYTVGESAFTG